MTDNKMMFLVTEDAETATDLQRQGYTLLNKSNGKYVFVYDDALSQKMTLTNKCRLTHTLTF